MLWIIKSTHSFYNFLRAFLRFQNTFFNIWFRSMFMSIIFYFGTTWWPLFPKNLLIFACCVIIRIFVYTFIHVILVVKWLRLQSCRWFRMRWRVLFENYFLKIRIQLILNALNINYLHICLFMISALDDIMNRNVLVALSLR